MTKAIMIRVVAEDFDKWLSVHRFYEDARKEYGMTEGPFYRDTANANAAQVTLLIEDLPRAMEWFKSDKFKAGVEEAGKVHREIWIAEKRGQ